MKRTSEQNQTKTKLKYVRKPMPEMKSPRSELSHLTGKIILVGEVVLKVLSDMLGNQEWKRR